MISIGTGLGILYKYENAPSKTLMVPQVWPSASAFSHEKDRATLVMFAHPHCACTRASIGELALLMTRCSGFLEAYVFYMKPKGFPENWAKTDLWKSAAQIPGVHVLEDTDGMEAKIFRATTSGEVLVYGKEGSLLFSGGITGSRGHAGDNAGRSSIVSLLMERKVLRKDTFVFGCSLFSVEPNNSVQEKVSA